MSKHRERERERERDIYIYTHTRICICVCIEYTHLPTFLGVCCQLVVPLTHTCAGRNSANRCCRRAKNVLYGVRIIPSSSVPNEQSLTDIGIPSISQRVHIYNY